MYIITAALIYANGPVHLGHIKSTYLPADIYTRYLRLKGEEALYVCATDDHGTPILLEAEKRGISPKELVRYYHEKDEKEFKALGIEFDIFHWTSSEENKLTTYEFYEALRPYIYPKKVMQYYCKELGRFLPDRYIKGKCKYCGAEDQYADQCEVCGRTLKPGDLIDPYCTLTKTRPELRESEHLFFKLSYFAPFLKEYVSEVAPEELRSYLDKWLEDLQDWDIVRDLEWGIPVPGHPGKVFYVWFDAPIGYIGSLRALRKHDWEEVWNKSKIYHFIGKDIIYHHYLFWPAMLKGANFNLPYRIPVRGYLTLEGKKFSKSRGWYLSLEDALNHLHPDYIRYYLTAITPSGLTDSDFSLDDLKAKINNELIANYGNLINRAFKLAQGKELPKLEMNEVEKALLEEYKKHMDATEFKEGLEIAMELVHYYNKLLSDNEPWKKPWEEAKEVVARAVYGAALVTAMLYPIIPFTTKKIAEHFKFPLALEYPKEISLEKPFVPFKKIEDETDKLKELLLSRSKGQESA
ncbi:MAG: methionine--tRNA ligase [Candidatus Micrarchaeota archaeon]|nr:methionine--tRNA ligase [Candidatus Micrarchaeota archaeon]